jgi:tetratricopeptide (TPR) repeat protein
MEGDSSQGLTMSWQCLIGPVAFLQAITAVFFLPVAAAQQTQPTQPRTVPRQRGATISGRVFYSESMKEAAHVRVRLLQSMGIPVDETFTDSDGAFEFSNLRAAGFTVEVSAEGYKSASRFVDLSSLMGAGMRITIILEPADKETPRSPSGGSTTSVQELLIPVKAREAFAKGLRELNEEGRPDQSVNHFQDAIEIYPEYDEAYVQLGLAYHSQGQASAAQATIEKALAVNAENARAHSFLGIIYREQEEMAKAAEALGKAVELDPQDWLAHTELAKVLLQSGSAEEAFEYARRAHELNSEAPAVYFVLSHASVRRRDFKAALATLDEFLRLQPESPWASQIQQERDNVAPLAERTEFASMPAQQQWDILMNAGQTAFGQGNHDQAEVFLQLAAGEAESLGSEDPRLAASLGLWAGIASAQRRYHSAEERYRRSVGVLERTVGPEHPFLAVTLNNLAELYRSQEQYDQAEPLYERSLAILQGALGPHHPNLATCLDNYAALLRETDRLAEAEDLEARAEAIRARQVE